MSHFNLFRQEEPADLQRQFVVAMIVILAIFFALASRFWYLQIAKATHFKELSEHNRIRALTIPPSRGIIFDRQEVILVNSRPSFNLYVIPDDVQNWDLLKVQLCKLLDMDQEQVEQRLAQKKAGPIYPIPVKLNITQDELGLIESYKYLMPGIYIEVSPQRNYPLGAVAPHVIGYLGEITPKQIKSGQYIENRMGDFIGQWGLEKEWQADLGGKKGGRFLEVDVQGQEIQELGFQESVPGNNLVTTLDWNLQKVAQEAFGQKPGAVVVLKPATGEILAMYSSPAFDPSSFTRKLSAREWKTLFSDPLKPFQNRAIQGQYPPGSIYKMIPALAGLEEKIITPETNFYCNGSFPFGNRVFHCWRKGGHGMVNLHKAIVQSCDVYFYNVGNRLGVDRLARYAQLFGLGKPTGVALFPEKDGLIPTSLWKLRRYKTPWQPGETLSVSIGQGYNLTTPLQMAVLTATLANGGKVFRPFLVKKLVSPQGTVIKEFQPQVIQQVSVNPEHLRLIQQAMAGVVNEGGGTGGAARLPGIIAAGKTGTAQVVSLGKKGGRDHAWFVAFAPLESPQLAMAILMEHGGHGGDAAAPIARKIFEAYFHLPPRGTGATSGQPEPPNEDEDSD
ncbi:MAG: penicillin-binding protein 2 [Desulfobacca sp.]|nr:penicillin-binding protein 2 [Desulfobacca sp.]